MHLPVAWWRRSKLTEVSFCGPVQKRLEAGRARSRTLLETSRSLRVVQRAETSRRTTAPAGARCFRYGWYWAWATQAGRLTEEADVVEREAEVGEGGVALEGVGEGAGAGAVEGVAGEVEEDEGGAALEGAGVAGGGVAGDVVVVDAEVGEAGAAADAVSEAVGEAGADAHGEVEDAEGRAGVEAGGEVLDAVLGEGVVRDVEVEEGAARGERVGEGVEVGASGWRDVSFGCVQP